jgi:hypothetical protein
MGDVISAHSIVGFEMADDRLDGGAAAQFAFYGLGGVPPLARDKELELILYSPNLQGIDHAT